MPKRKAEPTPAPVEGEPVKRRSGYLICRACERAVAYQGFDAPSEKDPWPLHRCGLDIKPFDEFSDDDPFRSLLMKVF